MPESKPDDYPYVSYRWDEAHAATHDRVEQLVYRPNILGADQRITNTSGEINPAKSPKQTPCYERCCHVQSQ